MKGKSDLSPIVEELVRLQRERSTIMRSRIMLANCTRSIVAANMGYNSKMAEAARAKRLAAADKEIERIRAGQSTFALRGMVLKNLAAVDEYLEEEGQRDRDIKALVRQLPIVKWMKHPDQKGFAEGSLGAIIGETGDLWNYANPAKVWKRMGCAPFDSHGEIHMGSTWRRMSGKGLSKDEWKEFGYSPRRRSVMYNVGACLIKANKGPYRKRYDEAKRKFTRKHRDASKGHCHNHAMLCMVKLLLVNLWVEWRR